MKPIVIVFIILIIIAAYSLFDQYLTAENFGLAQLKEKGSASVSSPISLPKPASQSKPEAPAQISEEIKPDKEEPVLSPYYGKIKIYRIEKETNYHPCLVSLKSDIAPEEKINLKGWKLKTRKKEITISENIIVNSYINVYLIGDASPFALKNSFRPDKCFGYLKSKDFYPSLYTFCSRPKLENLSHLTPYCQDFVLYSYGCSMPDYSKDFKISTDPQCVSYILDYFSYDGCVKRHSKDDDFLSNQWYLYLNSNFVEPLHDTIYLFDLNGLLVDKYTY